jgi:hypothetical protein
MKVSTSVVVHLHPSEFMSETEVISDSRLLHANGDGRRGFAAGGNGRVRIEKPEQYPFLKLTKTSR